MAYQILLVDDDSMFREEFRECLEYDYQVVEASTGEEALDILQKPNAIDLVILDVVMPGSHGTEVLKKIKRLYPHLIVIISTGYSSKDVAIEALKGHADDFIEKPLDIEKTLQLIEKYLRQKDGLIASAEGSASKVTQVKKYLERNYDKKVLLKDAADAVCLSPKYLSRIFEEQAGVGFNEYKLQVKMEKAKELLEQSGCNVDQISCKLGYANTESFIKMFRKITGQTPAAYRSTGKLSDKR